MHRVSTILPVPFDQASQSPHISGSLLSNMLQKWQHVWSVYRLILYWKISLLGPLPISSSGGTDLLPKRLPHLVNGDGMKGLRGVPHWAQLTRTKLISYLRLGLFIGGDTPSSSNHFFLPHSSLPTLLLPPSLCRTHSFSPPTTLPYKFPPLPHSSTGSSRQQDWDTRTGRRVETYNKTSWKYHLTRKMYPRFVFFFSLLSSRTVARHLPLKGWRL